MSKMSKIANIFLAGERWTFIAPAAMSWNLLSFDPDRRYGKFCFFGRRAS